MATCPECDAEIEVDEFDVDKGDELTCPDCGSNLEVTGLSPIELDLADEDDDDDDDDDEDEDVDDEDAELDEEDDEDEDVDEWIEKELALRETLSSLGTVVIAYSGGVDSAYLASVAHETLGDRALAVTADSPSYPEHHRLMALQIAERLGLRHEIIRTNELEQPDYRANPTNRCYFCKHELYSHLTRIAAARQATVVDGNNADDRGDYRPGRQAAREFGVRSPLDEVDLTKDEIRELSRLAGLPTWDEPASACLSSRIPYHSEVTDEKLRMIERAEQTLRSLGFRVCRVRHHEELARIEVARSELPRALEPGMAETITRALKGLGYRYVTIDLQGYRTGSLNEGIVLRLTPTEPDLAAVAASGSTSTRESA